MKKGTFLKKVRPPPSSYLISFLNVLRQNKALRDFPKRGQHSTFKRNIYRSRICPKYDPKDFNKFI